MNCLSDTLCGLSWHLLTRRYFVGAKLLEFVSNLAKDNTNVNDIYLHVQVTNEAAIAFYKKIGFEEIGT
jgi:ribosomal protein S18 acetylase RimI-like enzyme